MTYTNHNLDSHIHTATVGLVDQTKLLQHKIKKKMSSQGRSNVCHNFAIRLQWGSTKTSLTINLLRITPIHSYQFLSIVLTSYSVLFCRLIYVTSPSCVVCTLLTVLFCSSNIFSPPSNDGQQSSPCCNKVREKMIKVNVATRKF